MQSSPRPIRIRRRARAKARTLLLSAALLIGLAATPRAESPPASVETVPAIAGNPGAVDVVVGTGALGRLLGLGPETGIRLGGVLVSNGNLLLSGGSAPGRASFNNLLVTDFDADLEKLLQIPGATFGAALLRFDGQPTNPQAGLAIGYNGLPGAPPLDRTELYELWWRQSFFADKLVVRFGKSVPTYDFGNVVRPVPEQDISLRIPAVSGLIYTPVFVNPTMLGALPGYYNSAYGVTVTVAPVSRVYVSLGIYDGNSARGEQTGLRAGPTFNAYRFEIGEIGTAWQLGPDHMPGSLGLGVWDQTGTLTLATPQGTITQDGTHGVYSFAAQRLWGDVRDGGTRSVSGFVQFGANDSRTMIARRYVGLGLTAFGFVPGRPRDSFGAGLAWSWLNQNRGLRPDEAMIQVYDQLHVIGDVYLEPVLTLVPNPGVKTAREPAVAFTVQSAVLF
jgi:porin